MKVKLQKYIDKYGDGIHGTPAYDENGEYYFVNGNNLENGKVIINNDTLKITQEEYEKIKRPLTSNTILLSINGSLGKIAIYNNEKIALGKSACYLNVKENENKYFVKYVLSTDSFKKYMNLVAHGSTIKNLAPSQVVEYEFEEPKNRDKVAFILKNIDDKIYNNNKIISELESMAKTIYDYWFLQYEFPNAEGKPYKSNGGEMVYNDELKKEIPKEWSNGFIKDIGNVIAGGTPSTEHSEYYTDNGISWITPKDLAETTNKYINKGTRDITELGLKNSSANLLPKGTVLLTSRAPIGYIGISTQEVTTNQGFKSIVPKDGYNSEYVYYTINSMIPYLKNLGVGSTFSEISKDTVEKVKTIIPPKNIVDTFGNKIKNIAIKQELLEKENQELIKLRDYLLPLLMNGQVSFKN